MVCTARKGVNKLWRFEMKNTICKVVKGDEDVVFNFSNGMTESFNIGNLPEDIVHKLAISGLADKLRDGYSGVGGDVELAHRNVKEIWSTLKAGEFNRGRTGAGSQLAIAVSVVTGKPLEDVIELLKDTQTKKMVQKHPKVQAELLRMKQEALGDTDDAEDLVL